MKFGFDFGFHHENLFWSILNFNSENDKQIHIQNVYQIELLTVFYFLIT